MRASVYRSFPSLLIAAALLLVSCSDPESTGPTPQLAIAPTALEFSTTAGVNPDVQTVVVANSGDGELVWAASDDATWLSVTPTAGVGDATLTASVTAAGVAVGTQTAAITVTADGAGNSPRTVAVTLVVSEPPPEIGVTPTSLAFVGSAGGANPPAQTIDITNEGSGTLAWTATDDASWLTLSSASGTGAGTVTVSVDAAGMTAGTHTATITIAASGAGNTPRSVAVTLTLAASYSGSWTGKTSQDSTITMEIVDNAITEISFGFAMPACGVTGRTTTTFSTPVSVASGSFNRSLGNPPMSYTITGTFSSSTAVAGGLTLNWSQFGCNSSANVTWSGTRP